MNTLETIADMLSLFESDNIPVDAVEFVRAVGERSDDELKQAHNAVARFANLGTNRPETWPGWLKSCLHAKCPTCSKERKVE